MADSEDDETARRVRKLVVEHAETRWLALHMDNDIQEIRGELREVRATQQAHTAQFDSLGAQMRSLTQMVGEVLKQGEKLDEVLRLLRGNQPPGANGD